MSESLRESTNILSRSQSGRLNDKHRKEDQRRLIEVLTKVGDGSFFRGWRREVEHDGDFEIDFQDFMTFAIRLNFACDTYLLFGADGDHSSLTLEELAPFEGQLIQRFKEWIDDNFDSHRGFFGELRHSKDGQVSRADFCEGVAKHGFEAAPADINSLFDLCDAHDVGSIKLDDLIFLVLDPNSRAQEFHNAKVQQMLIWKQHAANDYMEFKKSQKISKESASGMSPKHRLAPRPWVEKTFELMPTVVASAQAKRLREAAQKARRSRIAFLEHLSKMYGNEVRGLRLQLAPGGYAFSNMTLRNYCRRLRLDIDTRDLWGALDKDKDGLVSIEELSVPSALALASFQKWARKNPLLGSCSSIWESPEARSASLKRSGTWYSEKKMLMGTFQETLKELGWPGISVAKTRNLLFSVLDSSGCGLITRADLDWLDHWRPVEWVYAVPHPEGLKNIKDLLVEIYGHPLRAWRCLLDQDDSNSLDYKEFKNACQRVGYHGNVAGAWRALDLELSGRVSMKQFDASSADLLASFKEWAEANFGSVKHFFKTLYTGDSHAITLYDLKRICHKMHWHGDVQLLFDCLDVDKMRDAHAGGKRSLTCDELAFLDSWYVEPTEEELRAEDAALEKTRASTSKTPGVTKQKVADITARLAAPILGRGYRKLEDLDLDADKPEGHNAKSLVDMVAAVNYFAQGRKQRHLISSAASQELRPLRAATSPQFSSQRSSSGSRLGSPNSMMRPSSEPQLKAPPGGLAPLKPRPILAG